MRSASAPRSATVLTRSTGWSNCCARPRSGLPRAGRPSRPSGRSSGGWKEKSAAATSRRGAVPAATTTEKAGRARPCRAPCPPLIRQKPLRLGPLFRESPKTMPVRQLPEQIVNRIAAGEVVERPASVVKELVENAIDAGASRIDIFSDGGGRRRIGITDDGGGMTADDLALAVDRHATSKLDDEDLLRIKTLGFRGEALPSIGAVAKLSITTRHASEPHAWSLAVEGGAKSDVMPAALSQGTRVEVADLFYATPARLKFLKTDRTEAEAIREAVRRLAMARPDIAFTLAGEERAPVTWAAALPGPPGRLTRLGDILGADFRGSAIE